MSSISFRVPSRLWNSFKDQTDNLFLARAPFLDHVLSVELPHLADDLAGKKLNTRTKRYIANQLTKNDPTSVTIDVRAETARKLREVVGEHNIVRDAFVCRLLIFLRAHNALLKHLEVSYYANNWGIRGYLEEMPASPLKAMEAVRDDPLFYIREHLLERHNLHIYTVELWPEVDWSACYLPAERVPGTGAYNKLQKVWAELLELPTPNAAKKSLRRSS